MRTWATTTLVAVLLLTGMVPRADSRDSDDGQHVVRVVYHFDQGVDQALRGLRNIGNHIAADPQAFITVVALGAGIDFLLEGAETEGGYPFDLMVSDLQTKGVQFKLCQNTLASRQLTDSSVIDGITIVPSGVAEIARLQTEKQHAYIKP